MLRYIGERPLDRFQNGFRGGMLWIQSTKCVCQLRQANSRVIAQSISQKPIHCCRRSALQNIQINRGVQKQWTANSRLVVNPWQVAIGPTSECPLASVWFE